MPVGSPFGTLPVVDVSPLITPEPARFTGVARQIEAACRVPEMRAAVLDHIDALTGLGQAVLRGVAPSPGPARA